MPLLRRVGYQDQVQWQQFAWRTVYPDMQMAAPSIDLLSLRPVYRGTNTVVPSSTLLYKPPSFFPYAGCFCFRHLISSMPYFLNGTLFQSDNIAGNWKREAINFYWSLIIRKVFPSDFAFCFTGHCR